ncbi:DUF7373 family lipoprotein [Nocardia yamanashiensis]|uniref:DUF7373 family lipoprotein n=1 Tax=Nocardia yamanashiensis TaxID=209247 RepID=UPI00082BAC43|nr:hypothetical protein [Nocardia yamanashiensis]
MVRTARTSLFAAAAVATALLLAACNVSGTPVAGELDVRKLEVGKYAVDRFSYGQSAKGNGALLEGFRMADAVVPSVKVDPSLIYGRGGRATVDAKDATDMGLAGPSQAVLERNNLIAGYMHAGSDQTKPGKKTDAGTTSVTNMVLRFADEKTAKTAARELEDADFNVAADLNRKLSLSQYPDAQIHWRPGVATIGTFLAYKQFVISLFIERPKADEKDLLEWVRKTLDAEVPVLDKFQPTPESKLSSLQVDPDNLLARLVTEDRSEGGTPDAQLFAVYGGAKLVHGALNQQKIQQAVTDSGADALATNRTSALVRTRDEAGARIMFDALIADEGDHYDAIEAPKDLPNAKCVRLNSKGDTETEYKNRCYVYYKRYLGVVSSDNESDVRQQVAAEYALLANSF